MQCQIVAYFAIRRDYPPKARSHNARDMSSSGNRVSGVYPRCTKKYVLAKSKWRDVTPGPPMPNGAPRPRGAPRRLLCLTFSVVALVRNCLSGSGKFRQRPFALPVDVAEFSKIPRQAADLRIVHML